MFNLLAGTLAICLPSSPANGKFTQMLSDIMGRRVGSGGGGGGGGVVNLHYVWAGLKTPRCLMLWSLVRKRSLIWLNKLFKNSSNLKWNWTYLSVLSLTGTTWEIKAVVMIESHFIGFSSQNFSLVTGASGWEHLGIIHIRYYSEACVTVGTITITDLTLKIQCYFIFASIYE